MQSKKKKIRKMQCFIRGNRTFVRCQLASLAATKVKNAVLDFPLSLATVALNMIQAKQGQLLSRFK